MASLSGLTPWPGAFSFQKVDGKPQLLKIWSAQTEESRSGSAGTVLAADRAGIVIACGEGALKVLELQREGGRRLSARDFLSGNPLAPGAVLGIE